MSRLRVRIELNRGGVGVPLHKLASVVQQAQAFFRMLGDDVHIDQRQGEWLGFDFDHESLNFTAEFVGPVTADQVAEFHSAFDGTTPLRRDTIAQFARIADAIDEDEVIGFGLYLNQGDDPAEWRCLSRRDALRITDEIQSLLGAGESGQESHLPAVADVHTGARYLFGRRDRVQEAAKLAGAVREVEANLSRRISRLEGEVADHSGHIQDLRLKSVEAEQSMGRLLSAVEGFCEQAATRLETVTAPAALAAAAAPSSSSLSSSSPGVSPGFTPPPASLTAPLPAAPPVPPAAAPLAAVSPVASAIPREDVELLPENETPAWWRSPTAISAGLVIAAVLMGMLLWPSRPSGGPSDVTPASAPARSALPAAAPAVTPPVQAKPVPAVTEQPAVAKSTAPAETARPEASVPRSPAPAVVGATRIELEATEPSWISIRGSDGATQVARLIEPGTIQSLDIREPAVLRAGNAGGLTIRANGKSLGPLGPHGSVREVAFQDGEFKLVPVKLPKAP
ncbi:MAG TPA: DUF4115 domain-containing protein [Bryobacteraceae bacterium]|nr:DUF4115 domain-containing protein [Bryobacteraceae bacterium]